MFNSRNQQATAIVLSALRRYVDAIRKDVNAFAEDPSKTEELDAAIRLTRTMRAASSLIGSFALNRVASLQEEVLESVAKKDHELDEAARSVLGTILGSIDAYAARIESQLGDAGEPVDALDELALAARAFRRYRGLPEADDEQEIAQLIGASQKMAVERPDRSGEPAAHAETEPEMYESPEVPAELLEVYREEADELIDSIYRRLGELEKDCHNRETIQEVRRAAHTLKGAAGAVGLQLVSRLSHRMEDLLDELYEGGASIEPDVLNLLATTVDLLHDVSSGEPVRQEEQAKLHDLYSAYDAQCGKSDCGHNADDLPGAQADLSEATLPTHHSTGSQPPHTARQSNSIRIPTSRLDDLSGAVSELIVKRISLEQRIAGITRCLGDLRPVVDRLRDLCRDTEGYQCRSESQHGSSLSHSASWSEQGDLVTPRHDAHFDDLEFDRFTSFDLWSQSFTEATGDLSTAWHELAGLADECSTLVEQQSRLTKETQDRLIQIQMVPFGTVIPRLQRALREVATSEGKAVDLIVEGDNVELDKIVLEEIVDPLLHLVRNAVDHGIESSDERMHKGKSANASVRISLIHFGTQIVMKVEDDGQGLDADRIRATVVKHGLIAADDVDSLPIRDLHNYIFRPGFSTASAVNEISGRGVGMDVVRSKIQELNGKIDVAAVAGEGTTFTIRLPVSMAVTRALMVVANDATFAIPQRAVTSIHRLSRQDANALGTDGRIRFGEQDVPLIHLRDFLGLPADELASPDEVLIAVLGSGEHQVALQVDGILPSRDIVVKGLGDHLARVPGLLGATILGDGTVMPILEPTDLISCGESFEHSEPARAPEPPPAAPTITAMIVDDSVSVRHVMHKVIAGAGWTAVTARDGQDALEKLAGTQSRPDVFLLDIEMPRMDGYELLSQLRQQPDLAHTPIIMVTSRSGEKHRQKAMDLGASAYVTKPFHEDALIDVIQAELAAAQEYPSCSA